MKPTANGFTLIEVAIVMVILGFLVSIGASMIGPLTTRMKTTEARETVNAAVEGIIGYGATNLRLPNLNPQFPSVVRAQSDPWGNPIQYIFDNRLTTSICDKTTTYITVRVCGNAACTVVNNVTNVAFVVLSSGANFNNQTDAGQAVGAARIVTTYSSGSPADSYAGDFMRATDEYDDVIKWVTLPELQTKLSCGRCSAYEVYYNLPAPSPGYFRVNGIGCVPVSYNPVNNIISSIGPGGNINGFADASCNTPMAFPSMSYTQAVVTDVSRNCAVNYNNTDR
jgi:prepilin-type N-terminal cleavage/methylation domain-containing protein